MDVKTFNPEHWPQALELPPGTRYVEADDMESMRTALDSGLAVHSVSCGGQVFVWPRPTGGFQVNHFFQGPPRSRHFRSADEAIGFAGSCIE